MSFPIFPFRCNGLHPKSNSLAMSGGREWGLRFGVNSNLIWQVNAAIGYRFSKNMSARVGCRGLGMDYSDRGLLVDADAH